MLLTAAGGVAPDAEGTAWARVTARHSVDLLAATSALATSLLVPLRAAPATSHSTPWDGTTAGKVPRQAEGLRTAHLQELPLSTERCIVTTFNRERCGGHDYR